MDKVTQMSGKTPWQKDAIRKVLEAHMVEPMTYIILVDISTEAFLLATNNPMHEVDDTLGRRVVKMVNSLKRLWRFCEPTDQEKPNYDVGVGSMVACFYYLKDWIIVIIFDRGATYSDEIYPGLERDLLLVLKEEK